MQTKPEDPAAYQRILLSDVEKVLLGSNLAGYQYYYCDAHGVGAYPIKHTTPATAKQPCWASCGHAVHHIGDPLKFLESHAGPWYAKDLQPGMYFRTTPRQRNNRFVAKIGVLETHKPGHLLIMNLKCHQLTLDPETVIYPPKYSLND